MVADPRDTGQWRRLRAEMRRHATHCPVCGVLLDHTRPRTSRYPSLDHVVPIVHGGDPFDRSNLRVTCTGCNSRKAARIRNGLPPRAADVRPRTPAAPPRTVRRRNLLDPEDR